MIELLEKYPKAAEVVRKYYLEKLIASLDANLPEDFKEHVREQGISSDMLAKITEGSPRMLFDVFDDNDVVILIGIEGDKKWNFKIVEFDKTHTFLSSGRVLENRKQAEQSAIEKAFELLEEKL